MLAAGGIPSLYDPSRPSLTSSPKRTAYLPLVKIIIKRPLPRFDMLPEHQAAAVDYVQVDLRIRRNLEHKFEAFTGIDP